MRTKAVNKRTTIIDSHTLETISSGEARDLKRERRHPKLDDEQLEHRREEIHDISPEGTPAHPEFTSGGVILMIVGSMAMIVVISLAVFIYWGFAAGAMVLVFGSALAFFGNPVIWTMFFRAEDIHEIEEEHKHDA